MSSLEAIRDEFSDGGGGGMEMERTKEMVDGEVKNRVEEDY